MLNDQEYLERMAASGGPAKSAFTAHMVSQRDGTKAMLANAQDHNMLKVRSLGRDLQRGLSIDS